ncbi:hypothetical protein [Proteus phage PM2]|uniref:Uncharacterized protein n=1 Tax=Proteus phage PM2 TaxID=2025809 RepID=A0A249XXT5_9CAUD|nr:hypothetical protein KNT71_gp010 [Proteus phage PM2]ASZ76296.1 hypothetical protein [Proteus phage PM2]
MTNKTQIHIIKAFLNEFYLRRLDYVQMVEEYGERVANEIMRNQNQYYYIETSYYQEQGDV